MLATWGASKSLAARVRDIFAKFGTNAHMYLAGTEITQGFTPGNYVESTGVTPATVDQPVGLVLDAAGSVGAELVTNGDFSNGLTGWTAPSTAPSSVDAFGGGARFNLLAGSSIARLRQSLTVSAGSYRVTYTVRDVTGSMFLSLAVGNGTSGDTTYGVIEGFTAGTYSAIYNVSAGTLGLAFTASSAAGASAIVDDVKVQQITGIHASQATSGFRPVERRGIVNLLTQSEFQAGLTDAPTRSNVTLSSIDGKNAIAFGTAGVEAFAYKTLAHTNGLTYTFACVVQMDDGGNAPTLTQVYNTCSFSVVMFANLSGTAQSLSLGSGKYLVTSTQVSYGAGNGFGIVKYGVSDSRTFKVTSYGLFTGTLTASQILAMGGIPLTTTAAASSEMGPYYLEHKAASTQFLTLGSNPIGATLTQPYTIVVAGIVGPLSTDRYMCGDLARAVGVSNLGLAFVAHGGNFSSGMSAGIAAGSTLVVEVTYDGSLLNVWINGVKKLTNFSLAASGSAAQPFALGQRGNNTGYWDGGLYPSFVTNSVLPDADRRLIAKQITQLAGVTL